MEIWFNWDESKVIPERWYPVSIFTKIRTGPGQRDELREMKSRVSTWSTIRQMCSEPLRTCASFARRGRLDGEAGTP